MNHDPEYLLDLASRVTQRILPSKVLAEEAAEQALHSYHLAVLADEAPDQPEAWIRTVARRAACGLLRSQWTWTHRLADETSVPAEERQRTRQHTPDDLRELLSDSLTDRQEEALEAALTNPTMRGAARGCQMQPRDFRCYLEAITKRARKQLTLHGAGNHSSYAPLRQRAG